CGTRSIPQSAAAERHGGRSLQKWFCRERPPWGSACWTISRGFGQRFLQELAHGEVQVVTIQEIVTFTWDREKALGLVGRRVESFTLRERDQAVSGTVGDAHR